MSTRIPIASLVALFGLASPAFAFHPHGGSTHFISWGHGSTGGVVGSPSGIQSFGVVPSGIQSFGVVPSGIQSFGVVPSGIQVFGVPSGIQSSGVLPSGVDAQGVQDWFNLIARGSQLIGGTGGATSQDITKLNTSVQSLKTELAAIRASNELIRRELTQIRKGMKFEDPPAPKNNAGAGANEGEGKKKAGNGADLPDSRAPNADAPILAAIDRDLTDIAALQKQIAEKEAKRAAARKQTAEGTGVAVTNR